MLDESKEKGKEDFEYEKSDACEENLQRNVTVMEWLMKMDERRAKENEKINMMK